MQNHWVRKNRNVPRKKDEKIVVLGSVTTQLRQLSRYSRVLFVPIPQKPLFSTTLGLLVKLAYAILSFGPQIVLVYPSYPFGLPSALIARLFRKLHVSFAYGNDLTRRRTRLGKLLVSLTVRLSHGFICDYEGLAKIVRQMGGRNVTTIPMGIDASDLPSARPKRRQNIVMCVVNFNLAYSKGVDLLIQAVKELPDAHLILIGDGAQRSTMISLAKKLHVSQRVTFTGYIPHKEIWTHLMNATIFALPTRTSISEGTNRAVLEAMLCGLPVVVTRTGGLPELIVDGVNGFVVEPENMKDLVKAVLTLLGNPKLRKRMGDANRIKAKKYTVNVLTAKRYEYLETLIRSA